MRNLRFRIAYNGAGYHGWQVQQNAITVQKIVQDRVERLFGRRLDVVGCSRTDTGVHAREFYFHMLTDSAIPCRNIVLAMNSTLPDDVAVLNCDEVPLSFHARYSCIGKEYVYQIWNATHHNPFLRQMAYHYPYPLNEERIAAALPYFLGRHDFTSFCSIRSDVEDKNRTITKAEFRREGNMALFTFRGNGFLYNMVRIMVGTLLFVSEGKILPEKVEWIIQEKNRELAGKTAPARGLYLNRVFYEEGEFDGRKS